MQLILTLVVVHLLSSDVCFIVLSKFLGRSTSLPTEKIYYYSRGLGPLVLALLAYLALVFLPYQDRLVYMVVVFTPFFLGALASRSEIPVLVGCHRDCVRAGWAWITRKDSLSKITLAVVLVGVLFGIGLPLVEHDALAAAIEARIAARDASFENYLAIDRPDPETGFFMETFRTPSLQSLYVVYFWVAGWDDLDLLIRTTSPIFAIHCTMLLFVVVRQRFGSRVASWAIFLLTTTPIFFYMSYNNGIDTMRIYAALLALLWLVALSRIGSLRVALVAGVISGLALFSHLLSVPVLLGGGLGFLGFGKISLSRRLSAGAVLVVAAACIGAVSHYGMSSTLLTEIGRSISKTPLPSSTAAPKVDSVAPRKDFGSEASSRGSALPQRAHAGRVPSDHAFEQWAVQAKREKVGAWNQCSPRKQVDDRLILLQVRGQGGSPRNRLIFGRLQMLTGIEHFGFIFYFFWLGLLVAVFRRMQDTQDRLLAVAGLMVAFIVLSGIRKLSWSNPRYISTLLPIAAYFAAPLLARLEARWFRVRWKKALVIGCILMPLLTVTAVRGAKIELTNPGDFYADFRSLRWLEFVLEEPTEAASVFWEDYLGFRRTLSYLFSDTDTQVRNAHDYLNSVLWVRDHLPEDVHVLVFREARFFYYGERKGSVWYSPAIDQKSFGGATTVIELAWTLRNSGVTHVLVDDYSTLLPGYAGRCIDALLASPMAELVYEYGTSEVYRLLPADS